MRYPLLGNKKLHNLQGANSDPWPTAFTTATSATSVLDIQANVGRMKTTGTATLNYTDFVRAWLDAKRFENFEQYCEFTFNNALESYFNLNFRGQATPNAIQLSTCNNGFYFECGPTDTQMHLSRTDAGTQTTLQSVAFQPFSTVPYGLRVTCYGPIMEVKAWQLSLGEQTAAIITWLDYLHYQGQDRDTFGPGCLGGAAQGFDVSLSNYSLKQIRRAPLKTYTAAGPQAYTESVVTTCAVVTSVVDSRAMFESVTTTGAVTTGDTDLKAMVESVLTTATVTTSDTDVAAYQESVLTTAIATTSESDTAVFNESLVTTAAALTGDIDTRAMFEVVTTTASVTTSEFEQLALFEFPVTTATVTTSESDTATMNESVVTTANVTTSQVDALNGAGPPPPSMLYQAGPWKVMGKL